MVEWLAGNRVIGLDSELSSTGFIYSSGIDTYTFTGADESYTVPSGITSLAVKMWGAGAGGYANGGGSGGFVSGTVAVSSGDVIKIVDGAITSAKLASGVGGVDGISSSANATAISIDSSEVVRLPVGILRLQNATTGTADTDGLLIEASGNDVYINNKENADMYFRTNNTDRLKLHDNGVLSAVNGIALGVGTANTASNVLDDYEEGLHTVALSDTSGNVTSIVLNSSFNQLAYTKIGRVVHISGTLVISSFSGTWGSGVLRMTLPFTTADLTDQGGKSTMSVGTYNVDYTTGTSPYIQVGEGVATADFYVSGDNTTGGKCQPATSGQLYIGGFFIAA